MENRMDDYLRKNEERKIKQDILSTEYKKNKFISEIRRGLGDEIIKEPNKVQKKIKWYHKLFKMLLNG